MRIILTNDDGIYSVGLRHLWKKLKDKHEVHIIAPKSEQSGISHAFTLYCPLRYNKMEITEGIEGWAVDGTPADCVKMGIANILSAKPDLVISGINAGDNAGISHHYSGTVAAAREAALWGIAGVAISISIVDEEQYEHAADFLSKHIGTFVEAHKKSPVLLNINVPSLPVNKIKGAKITSQGCTMFDDHYIEHMDPRQNKNYWITGDKPQNKFEKTSDDKALQDGFISITPLSIDSTNHATVDLLKKGFND